MTDPMQQPEFNQHKQKPDFYDWIGYVLAAAILIPLGWWLKANHADNLGAWITGLF